MTPPHNLLLLRHAQAVDSSPSRVDHERPLTEHGIQQASGVGDAIRARGMTIDQVFCSSATRTRQTWSALGLNSPCEFTDQIYSAGSDSLLEFAQLIDEQINTAMIIGHGPGLPRLAVELAGPGSDRAAVDTLNSRYPTATVTEFEIDRPWAELRSARLVWLRLGSIGLRT